MSDPVVRMMAAIEEALGEWERNSHVESIRTIRTNRALFNEISRYQFSKNINPYEIILHRNHLPYASRMAQWANKLTEVANGCTEEWFRFTTDDPVDIRL